MRNIVFLIKKSDRYIKFSLRNKIFSLLEQNHIEIKHKNYTRINLSNCYITIKELNLKRINELKNHKDDLIFCLFRNRGDIFTRINDKCSSELTLIPLDILNIGKELNKILPYIDSTQFVKQERYYIDAKNKLINKKELMVKKSETNKTIIVDGWFNFYLTEKEAYIEYNNYLIETIKELEKKEQEYIRQSKTCKLEAKKYENVLNNNKKYLIEKYN